jgi:hypothetical protein
MKLVATIEDGDPDVVAAQCRYFLEGVVGINRRILRKRRKSIPPLYESGVVFRVEPWADEVQFYANIEECIFQRWADCKMACAWRMAEHREAHPGLVFGFRFSIQTIKGYGKPDALHAAVRGASRAVIYDIYHVQIELPDGFAEQPIEDVSRFLHQ